MQPCLKCTQTNQWANRLGEGQISIFVISLSFKIPISHFNLFKITAKKSLFMIIQNYDHSPSQPMEFQRLKLFSIHIIYFLMALVFFQMVQIGVSLFSLAQQTQIAHLKIKIRQLYNKHKHQFETLAEIYLLFEHLSVSSVLPQVLDNAGDLAFYHWKILAESLDQQIDFVKTLTSQFKDVKLPNDGLKDHLMRYGIGVAATCLQMTSIASGAKKGGQQIIRAANKQMHPSPEIFELHYSKKGKGFKGNPKDVPLGEMNGEQVTMRRFQEVDQLGDVLQKPKASSLTKTKKLASKTISGVAKGFRVLGFIASAYAVVLDTKQIGELIAEVKRMEEVFGEKGSHKQLEQTVINSMVETSEFITNLVQASRVALAVVQDTLLFATCIHQQNQQDLLNDVDVCSAQNLQMDDDFAEAAISLCQQSVSIKRETSGDRLHKLKEAFSSFNKRFTPTSRFQKLQLFLGQFLKKLNGSMNETHVSKTQFNDFKRDVMMQFLKRKQVLADIDNDPELDFEGKRKRRKKQDKERILLVSNLYLTMLKSLGKNSEIDTLHKYKDITTKLPEDMQKVIANIALCFTDEIFAETEPGEKQGKKIFGMLISDCKGHVTCSQLTIPESASMIHFIPLIFETDEGRKQSQKPFEAALGQLIIDEKLPDLKDNKKFVILKFERAIRLRKIDRESSSSVKRTQKRIFDDGMVVRCLEKGSQDEKKYFITKVDEKWRAIDLATLQP